MTVVLLLPALASGGEMEVARAALRDGLWDIARRHASLVESDEAKLVILESFVGEGRWDEVGRMLSLYKDAKGDGFDYYRAILKGDHAAAMAVLKRGGSELGCVEAKMFEAAELAKGGRDAEAKVLWREVVSVTNVGERTLAAASMNLDDPDALRVAYAAVRTLALKRTVGLRLGRALLKSAATAAEGAGLIRAIVRDAPDATGALDAFLALATAEIDAGRWQVAGDILKEAVEVWPQAAKVAGLHENRGWVLQKLGRPTEALEAFQVAESLSTDAELKAKAVVKQGDVLAEMGRDKEAMERYERVLKDFPNVSVSGRVKQIVEVRALEEKGRELYRSFRFKAAMQVFQQVAASEASLKPEMDFLCILCLYGQGLDEEAAKRSAELASSCADSRVRAMVTLWLAKFSYNRREWKSARRLFSEHAVLTMDDAAASESLLWAARAAFADSDFTLAIQLSTRMLDRYPGCAEKPQALILQGEALIEQARFGEAVLLFDRVAAIDGVASDIRSRAQMLKADALYSMGADNSARYAAALETYDSVRMGSTLSPSRRLVLSFKIARTLEKLKRLDEARDCYYTQVVQAYRDGRLRGEHFDDDARAAFSRAAFLLADDCESRGLDRQALGILELVTRSDVPAADEARRRIERINAKGRFL